MKTILTNYSEHFGFPVSDDDINQIFVYLEQRQVKKLHFEYGELILLIALKWSENKEDFEVCAAIKKFIETVNKYSNNKIAENLEQWTSRNTLIK